MDSSHPDFWDARYRAGRMPWDAQGVPSSLIDFLRRQPKPGRALIPGCGFAYEVRSLHEAGWDVTAIDFSPAAVSRASLLLEELSGRVRIADFFRDELPGDFDLIYERTFLCSLPLSLWPDYAERTATLLRPGGVLAGIFFYGDDPEPPPHPLTPATAERLLGHHFRLIEDRPIPADQTLPVYGGAERWQVWQRLRSSSAPPSGHTPT